MKTLVIATDTELECELRRAGVALGVSDELRQKVMGCIRRQMADAETRTLRITTSATARMCPQCSRYLGPAEVVCRTHARYGVSPEHLWRNRDFSLLGSVLNGRFALLAERSSGGCASVYDAVNIEDRTSVVVKVSHGTPPFDDLLANELIYLKRLTTLNHPNLIKLLDSGVASSGPLKDRPFLVLEPMGGSVGGWLTMRDRLSPSEVLHILTQLSAALQAIHTVGIVHRDIKPQNILVSGSATEPTVKLVDFGTACQAGKSFDSRMIGTPAFMSPEAIRRQPVDHRTDIFSLGITIFVLLTGRKPFDGSLVSVLQHLLERPLPSLGCGLEAFDPVLRRATAKAPDARYRSVTEFVQAFAKATVEGSPSYNAWSVLEVTAPVRDHSSHILSLTSHQNSVHALKPSASSVSVAVAAVSAPTRTGDRVPWGRLAALLLVAIGMAHLVTSDVMLFTPADADGAVREMIVADQDDYRVGMAGEDVGVAASAVRSYLRSGRALAGRRLGADVPDGLYHEVQRGETLWSLSRRYGVRQGTIASENDIVIDSELPTGTKIRIPARPYVVEAGDSLSAIAAKCGVGQKELVQLNQLADPDKLVVGMVLWVSESSACD